MRKKLKIIILFFTIWFVVHEVLTIYDGLTDEVIKSEYAVIFGNTVNEDGTLSKRLLARVSKGLELYRDSLVSKIYVSGGLGKEGYNEGTIMAEYLISQGVDSVDILIDNNGNNTRMTAENFVAEVGHKKSVILITQFYHVSRSRLAFKNAHVDNVCCVHADYFEIRDFYSSFREFFGYYKYLITK